MQTIICKLLLPYFVNTRSEYLIKIVTYLVTCHLSELRRRYKSLNYRDITSVDLLEVVDTPWTVSTTPQVCTTSIFVFSVYFTQMCRSISKCEFDS